MRDELQEDLKAWVDRGDRRAGNRALDLLAREWRPRVRYFLHAPSEDEVEEVLAEAIYALVVVGREGRPRILAGDDVSSPAAHRRTVLRNHLCDRHRRSGRRRHAERGVLLDLAPQAEAAAWKQDRKQVFDPELKVPTRSVDSPAEERVDRSWRRERIARVLHRVAIRRRVLVMLALAFDPVPFVVELAIALKEDETATLGRMEQAKQVPPEDPLPIEHVRVVYPVEPEKDARESARKALERARDDLGKLLRMDA